MTAFERFPDITCFSYGTGGVRVHLRDKSERQPTELEFQWFRFPPDSPLDILIQLNKEESDAPLCERCDEFHMELSPAPVRTMYADREQPQPVLCPHCTEEWNDMWDEMWFEYYSGCL